MKIGTNIKNKVSPQNHFGADRIKGEQTMQSTLKFEQLIYLLASVVRRLNDKPKKAKK